MTEDTVKNIPFISSYISTWKRTFDYSGKTKRREFFEYVLVQLLLFIVLILLGANAYNKDLDYLTSIVFKLFVYFYFAHVIPSLSLQVRRLRDSGASLFWSILIPIRLIPKIGLIASLILLWKYAQPSVSELERMKRLMKRTGLPVEK